MKEYGHYIHGEYVNSDSGKTFVSLNPSNKHLLARFQQGTAKDVEKAVDAAEKALPAWSSLPAPQRGEILFEVARLLKKNKERLGRLVSTEMGKVLPEGLGDVQEAIDVFEYMAGEGRRLFGHTTPSELKNKFCSTIRTPVGVCGLIAPWNFPIAIPAWKLAPALICGNTSIIKPSSDTPLCVYELVQILAEAGIPKGVVNIITGVGEEVGHAIVTHPRIRAISFTGSRDVGEWITKNIGIKRLGLELGGKNAIILMEDANLELAMEGILFGAFGTTGQRCTAASRLIVHKNIKQKVEDMLIKRTEKLKVGDPLKSSTDVGPLIAQRAVDKTHRYVDIGTREKAKLVSGGYIMKGKGFFYKPTIFTDVKPAMRIAQEEIFGPVISLITANDFDDAIKICNATEYGLSSSIYTANINKAFRAIEKLEAGITYVNAPTIGAEVHLPFGGVKKTGNGTREAGIEGINEFSEIKTVYIDYSGRLQKAQIDN